MKNIKVLAAVMCLASGLLWGCGREESYGLTELTEFHLQESGNVRTEETAERIAVYVRGAVKKPGVYYLPDGSRIYQAIEKAGGFTEEADTQWLNQAELLTDGEMLTVVTMEETSEMEEAAVPAAVSAGSAGQTSLVNLNSASKEELMSLPGIGESKADSIIRYREENGPFASPEDVMNISGIKTSVYSKIKDRITV